MQAPEENQDNYLLGMCIYMCLPEFTNHRHKHFWVEMLLDIWLQWQKKNNNHSNENLQKFHHLKLDKNKRCRIFQPTLFYLFIYFSLEKGLPMVYSLKEHISKRCLQSIDQQKN